MTDSTSAGVLIQSPSPNSRTSLRARECLPCTSKFRPSHRSCIHSITGTPAQLFCQMLSTRHCRLRVLENHPDHQCLHSHAARAGTALGTKGPHPIAFPSTNYPQFCILSPARPHVIQSPPVWSTMLRRVGLLWHSLWHPPFHPGLFLNSSSSPNFSSSTLNFFSFTWSLPPISYRLCYED